MVKNMKKALLLLVTVLLVALTGCAAKAPTASQTPATGSTAGQNTQTKMQTAPSQATPSQAAQTRVRSWSSPPPMQIDPTKSYSAIIHTTYGDITLKLFAADAPKTVNNFVFLAKNHFYDGLKFHRVIKNFMIQTGDPNGDGSGGPGYQFADELSNKHKYEPGVVAMANAGPNTNGSQFFIGSGPDVASLNQNPNYTIFGQVVSGMNVVEKIAAVQVGPNSMNELSSPLQPVNMKSVDIIEK